jgi:hypothetical protein
MIAPTKQDAAPRSGAGDRQLPVESMLEKWTTPPSRAAVQREHRPIVRVYTDIPSRTNGRFTRLEHLKVLDPLLHGITM